MSWFDATGLATIAKTALKGAQRTIDKALDIKEDSAGFTPSTITSVDTNSEDLYQAFGHGDEGISNNTQASMWGSFTGSFFDGAKDNNKAISLDDTMNNLNKPKPELTKNDDGDNSLDRIGEKKPDISVSPNVEEEICSDSIELITSGSECTSPNSEAFSLGISKFETVPDSLTSPSSIEVIDFRSPVESTPDSVEIISEDFEEEASLLENSREDSMTFSSLSESTATTVMDSMSFIKPKSYTTRSAPIIEEKSHHFDAITSAPSRGMHLPLTQVNEVLIDTQPHASNLDISNIMKYVMDPPKDTDSVQSLSSENPFDLSNDESSQSDRTLKACEMESSSDNSITETSTSCLQNMLADAMTEKSAADKKLHQSDLDISLEQLVRDSSPISSESRSDMVKIGSDHTSGHTSGDELETATSSDIEIISSPNGDSSSTYSRHSPAKQLKGAKTDCQVNDLLCKLTMKKAKGHTRELSEASSISDDSSEMDRLLKRISDLTDILEARESRVIDLNRKNAELHELNSSLQDQLDAVISKQLDSQDVSQVAEDYTQRLSALEKKFQQAIREKDALKKQLEHSKVESAARLSRSELDMVVVEKDEVIKQLREEGEKLAKQHLQHSNIIKKLRAKEKENETTIKHLKEKTESLSGETERLTRTLNAKEEVERSQIDAIHQLTTKNKKLESEAATFHSQIEDLTQKYETAKKSLDAAKEELSDKSKINSELLTKKQLLESLENQKKMAESQNEEVIDQLEYLRTKLYQNECDFKERENRMKEENVALMRRLEDAEVRNEELSQSVLEVSKPLVRQLESLQSTHNMKVAQFEKIEKELDTKIDELQKRLQISTQTEKQAKEDTISLRSKLSEFEGNLSTVKHNNEMLKMQLEQQKTEFQITQHTLQSNIDDLLEKIKTKTVEVEDLTENINILQQQLTALQDSPNSRQDTDKTETGNLYEVSSSRSNSPTLSLGKASVADSLGSSFWSQDEPFDIGNAPRYSNVYEMQILQTKLKQRDGEVQQLQWELNRREQERTLLNTEISILITKVDALEKKNIEYDALKVKYDEIQQQYDTLCQLYGEKVEECEELKLDLQESREAYKEQLDGLLRQERQKE